MSYRALDVSLDGESTPSTLTSAPDPGRNNTLKERSQSVGMLLRHKSADEEIDRTLSDHVDMAQVMRDAEEERKARQLAEDGQHSAGWRCAKHLLCGETLLVQIRGGRYWRTTLQLYREQAELEAIRVVMVEGQPNQFGVHLSHTITPLPPIENFSTVIGLSIVLSPLTRRRLPTRSAALWPSLAAHILPQRA